MSYSYVKCFEGSVVWNISKLLHEGILISESNIICVQLVANRERVRESGFPASAYRRTDPAGRSQEHRRASTARWGWTWPSGALQTWTGPDPGQPGR